MANVGCYVDRIAYDHPITLSRPVLKKTIRLDLTDVWVSILAEQNGHFTRKSLLKLGGTTVQHLSSSLMHGFLTDVNIPKAN